MSAEHPHHAEITRILATVRRRWRLRRLLWGLTGFLGIVAPACLMAAWAMDTWHFAPAAVTSARIVVYLGIAVALAGLLLVPLLRRASDTRLALYTEENEPSLGMALVSAVELREDSRSANSPALEGGLLEKAVQACHGIGGGRRVDAERLKRAGTGLVACVALLVAVGFAIPDSLRNGLKLLFSPGIAAEFVSPYGLSVEPGDVLVSRGADQLIVATVEGFEPEQVTLASRAGPGAPWQESAMSPGADAQTFERFLFDLDDSLEYYVSAGALSSGTFRIQVADLPKVEQIDLVYNYPNHTGIAPQRVVDGGDISAVRGTRVDLTITVSRQVSGAALVLDGDRSIPMTSDGEERWSVSLPVEHDGHYRIDLPHGEDLLLAASPDYVIEVLPDRAPLAGITYPGRDTQVTSVEEPVIEITASDDMGIGRLELVYSINGGEEQILRLDSDPGLPREARRDHVLYLEDLALSPGDFIAYHARAWDTGSEQGQQSTTDIFFMEVRPFERSFRQGQGGGGGGGFMGGQQERSLSAQQREFVIATFKLVRDRDRYEEKRFEETVETLARAQTRIRARVEAIIRRLGTRSIMQMQEGFQLMARELPEAVRAMRAAEAALNEAEPNAALPPAREALQHLQRAEAAFRDVQVARSRAGGGGNAATDAEDLANLFKLEMDKLRNQYENVQRGNWEPKANAMDETLEELRRLAKRQQKELERKQRRADLGFEGGGDSQRQLAEAVEDVIRRLERLSREQRDERLRSILDEARKAASAMRRSASQDSGEGLGDAQAAIEHLREARRLLEGDRQKQLEQGLAKARGRLDRLEEHQRGVEAGVGALPAEDSELRSDLVNRLRQRKWQMAEEAREMESELHGVARKARELQHESEKSLRGAAEGMHEERLAKKFERSADALDDSSQETLERLESEIGQSLRRLNESLAEAAKSLGESGGEGVAGRLERMRDLVQDLESLRSRIERQASSRGSSGQPAGRAGSSSRGAQAGNTQGGWGWDGGFNPREIEQYQGEFHERRGELEALVGDLDRQRHAARDIRNLIDEMRALEQSSLYRDPEALLERQSALIAALKEMEFRLRQTTDESDPRSPVFSGNDSVPRDFRSLIDDYFRDLSRSATE
jgi:hypothetical protein